jgi:hypothetical protein
MQNAKFLAKHLWFNKKMCTFAADFLEIACEIRLRLSIEQVLCIRLALILSAAKTGSPVRPAPSESPRMGT